MYSLPKYLKFLFVLNIFLIVCFAYPFEKREINIYFNDISTKSVSVIEKFYFKDNVSYEQKKRYLNVSFLLNKINPFLKPCENDKIKATLIGDGLNTLEIKYTSNAFEVLDKRGRFVKYIFNTSKISNEFKNNNSIVLNNYTILKLFVLKDINSNFYIPENVKDKANIYLSDDGSYIVYEFDGPITLKSFKIIKEYKEPILNFNSIDIVSIYYVISGLVLAILIIVYFDAIVNFLKKVFR